VYEKYSTKGRVERLIKLEANTTIGGDLSVILYFLVVWLGVTFSSTQIAAMFAQQDASECL